ncbi:hypothetical protein AB0G32_11690 [Streptomyces sp. NPDC023723]|uniref:Acg family FMN-binding oxidoreductase n=1 Tax=Streptomyces sp. NPDC023723 TaxID=3154323 RepID=UPI0033E121BC
MSSPTLDVATLERLVAAAVTAPSLHNSQPWRFGLEPDTRTIKISAATHQALPHTDPVGRAVHLSVGCAVLNLRVAAVHFGWEPVTRLLPSPAHPALLATVRLAGAVRTTVSPGRYETLWRRHSSRLPFSDRPLPVALLTELSEAAHAEGGRLFFPDEQGTDRILRATWEAERRNRMDADRAAESRHWLRRPGSSATGVPQEALGPQDALDGIPMRDFGAHRHPAVLPARSFERHPHLAVLCTAHDRRADWLRAGQALERVLLLATAHGVRTSLLHQGLEWTDLRGLLSGGRNEAGHHVQMVLRMGYGPEGSPSPRLGVADVMESAQRRVFGPCRCEGRTGRSAVRYRHDRAQGGHLEQCPPHGGALADRWRRP